MDHKALIKRTIRRLKKKGTPCTFLIAREQGTINLISGAQTLHKTPFLVRRTIPLPASTLREFVYDLDYIAANSNFTQGGFIDVTTKFLLVDGADIKGVVINNDDECIVNEKYYRVRERKPTDYDLGFIFRISEVKGVQSVFSS